MALLMAWMGACVTGCGDSGGTRARSAPGAVNDGEHVFKVDPELGPIDADDYALLHFGRVASRNEVKRISALIRRYYAAAAAKNGLTACSMLYLATARSVAEEEGRRFGMRGSKCAAVMSRIFEQHHRLLIAEMTSLKVLRVRTDGVNGLLLLRFGHRARPREQSVRRVGAEWKIARSLDTPVR